MKTKGTIQKIALILGLLGANLSYAHTVSEVGKVQHFMGQYLKAFATLEPENFVTFYGSNLHILQPKGSSLYLDKEAQVTVFTEIVKEYKLYGPSKIQSMEVIQLDNGAIVLLTLKRFSKDGVELATLPFQYLLRKYKGVKYFIHSISTL